MHTSTSFKSLRFLAVVVLIVAVSPVFASEYYVDAVDGDDANDGRSVDAAWQTLQHAADSLPVSKSYPAGEVTLGGNDREQTNAISNYFGFVCKSG